jgi:hypothetical protein
VLVVSKICMVAVYVPLAVGKFGDPLGVASASVMLLGGTLAACLPFTTVAVRHY